MSFEDACRELGISQAELEQLVAAGELASMKDGEAICFKPEVVKLYKESKGDPMVLLADEDLGSLRLQANQLSCALQSVRSLRSGV